MAIGLSPDRAFRLAREMEVALHREGVQVIRRDELRRRVHQALLREAGRRWPAAT